MNIRKWSLTATAAMSVLALVPMSAQANNGDPGYFEYDGGMTVQGPDLMANPGLGGLVLNHAFDGISQSTVRSLHSNFSEIPPDTNGAAGLTQYMETTNGAYAVYDKATGTQTKLWADGNFWAQAGQPDMNGFANFSNGDSRVLFDTRSDRWIVTSFGADLDQIAIAISDTPDATGGWKSVTFTGYAGGIADYPTLGIDSKAVYIGTNNFNADDSYAGTTLNVIARDDLFGPGAPTVTSLKQFTTDVSANMPLGPDRGFAIQGVNQVGDGDSGQILAVGSANYGFTHYSVTNPGTAGATQTASTLVSPLSAYMANQLAAQPDGSRTLDPLDDRISSTVWELNGKIYAVHTITALGADHTEIEWQVIDAATGALVQKGVIGDADHDYFQGAITVNADGQIVISYNRAGFGPDGNVAVMAQGFRAGLDGTIARSGSELMLHQSSINNYHNGGCATCSPSGRQRWGDYAQVSVDPTDPHSFWVIGEYARPYDSPTSNSRWGTWISKVDLGAVPEPSAWMLMLMGVGLAGVGLRRRRGLAA